MTLWLKLVIVGVSGHYLENVWDKWRGEGGGIFLTLCVECCLVHHVPIIVSSRNFQELLPMTKVTSMQKVKVTEVNNLLNRFRTVTLVWIHIWWWNDAYSLMMPYCLMMHIAWWYLMMPYCLSRSSVKFQGYTAQKSVKFDPDWAFRILTPAWIHQWLRNDAQSLK